MFPSSLSTSTTYRKQRVLYLCRGGGMSGSERQLELLIDALDPKRFVPVVVESACSSARHPGRKRIELLPWRKLRNIFARYRCALNLLQYARAQKVDLVHCSYQWLTPYATFVSRMLGIPLVLHLRRPGARPTKLVRQGFAAADAIIAISARIERELAHSTLLRNKVWLIEDAVAPEFFEPLSALAPTDLRPDDETVVFAMAGRIEPNKRQHVFLQAAKQLKQACVRARFVIIGPVDDPAYHQGLQDYITSERLEGHACLLGEHHDMAAALRSIDVLVSLAGGSVMYEAMASGKPVLSAGFTPPGDSVHVRNGETGLVIDSRTPEALANACKQFLDRQTRQRLGRNAERWARRCFAHDALARRTEQVYSAVLDGRA